MNRIINEAKEALNAKTWNEQLQFIQFVEEIIMDDIDSISFEEIQSCFSVLSKYVTNENKNLVQRSMKIIEALCQCYNDFPVKFYNSMDKDVSLIFKSVFKCLNDNRPNIREQSIKTLQLLIKITGFTAFCQNTLDQASSFCIEGQSNVIQFLKQHQYDMNDNEWKLIFHFLLHTYEGKVPALKNKALDLFKNDKFLNQLQINLSTFNPSQKKTFQAFLDRQTVKVENSLTNENNDYDLDDDVAIDINSSVFSHKQRQKELKDTDGLFLLTDVSSFGPFTHRLSLDIRDVFDDKISDLLLSQQSIVRVTAVDDLREIFCCSMKNFEYSVDIIIRWCLIQFLSWQLNISQASLSLLTDMLDYYKNNEKFKLTSKEVHIITPIVLWCMANQSEAFKYLLQQVKYFSFERDYNDSLLMSLSLDHIPVIIHIFDELKTVKCFDTIRGRLEELSQESTTSFAREECKKLLMKHNPLSPRKSLMTKNPVKTLQMHIKKIKNNPDGIANCRDIFGQILDMFDSKTLNRREIRYLLYCTHAFMSEPVLYCQINMNDFSTLVSLLCEFSLRCPAEFFDALISVGYAIATVQASISIFDTLINFISQNISSQNKNSFSYQIFRIGIQLIAINQSMNDLQHFKSFAKSVIGRFQSKDDLRARLCRELLAEILIIENGSIIQFGENKNNIVHNSFMPKSPESVSTSNGSTIANGNGEELHEFVRILKRLMKLETRFESIQELISFSERYPREKIIETIVKLSPLLGRHIEEMKNKNNLKLKSTPSNRRNENISKNIYNSFAKQSRPSSRSSKRLSDGYDLKKLMKSRIPLAEHKNSSKIPSFKKKY